MKKCGRVSLVGAGPGDPELLTVKAVQRIKRADVIVYDRLVSREILALAPSHVRMISVGKLPKFHPVTQTEINELLVSLASKGLTVVRLKGGDPFIFGRGSEEAAVLQNAGIPLEVIPGITAAQGAAASTGVPLTHRGLAGSVRYVTGHCRSDLPLDLDWGGLADTKTTLVIYMGAATIGEITENLIAHDMPAELPVMVIANATTPREEKLITDLGSVTEELKSSTLSGPILFVVGEVVSLYRSSSGAGLDTLISERVLAGTDA